MANGQQLAEQNLAIFNTWLASKTDDDFRLLVSRGVLSRKEIATECGFSKSALDQNPRIKAALKKAEGDLRERGILTQQLCEPKQAGVPPVRESSARSQDVEVERLRRLELENASLRTENKELKRQLAQYAVIREALALSGRAPR